MFNPLPSACDGESLLLLPIPWVECKPWQSCNVASSRFRCLLHCGRVMGNCWRLAGPGQAFNSDWFAWVQTTVSTLAAVVTTPFLVQLLVGSMVPVDPAALLSSLLQVTSSTRVSHRLTLCSDCMAKLKYFHLWPSDAGLSSGPST